MLRNLYLVSYKGVAEGGEEIYKSYLTWAVDKSEAEENFRGEFHFSILSYKEVAFEVTLYN